MPINVVHCITSLCGDGAQRVLLRLTTNLNPAEFNNKIINLRGHTPLADEFEARGIRVCSLNLGKNINPFKVCGTLKKFCGEHTDIIQGWMEHGNFFALILKKILNSKPVVLWNIRRSLYNLSSDKFLTQILIKLSPFFSSIPAKIIFCSPIAVSQYQSIGLSVDRAQIIPNGFDVDLFSPNPSGYNQLRTMIGLPMEARIIGSVARYHPQKDHKNLIQSAYLLKKSGFNAHFVLVGKGVDAKNLELNSLIQSKGVGDIVHLLGPQENIMNIISGFDIFCLHSFSEGFPNAVGEAMACSVPCIVTNCGAAASLVGETGRVVPVDNPESLAAAMKELLLLPLITLRELGRKSRERILQQYSLPAIVELYSTLYKQNIKNTTADLSFNNKNFANSVDAGQVN